MFRRLSSSLRFLSAKMQGTEECNIVIVGLDNGGKSTVINYLQSCKDAQAPSGAEEVAPTVGFRVETFKRNNLNFTAFDMSGQGKYRNLWEKQYTEVHGIIFVIDSSDKLRMAVARDELEMLLANDTVKSRSIPILFMANKKDREGAASPAECVKLLALEDIQQRAWSIMYVLGLTLRRH